MHVIISGYTILPEMPSFFTDACVLQRTDETLPVIAVSAYSLAFRGIRPREMTKSREKLRQLRVSRIINVCTEVIATAQYLAMFKDLGIAYHHFPIPDDERVVVPASFLQLIADTYKLHDAATGIILIHCHAGVNRSMLAAAYLLWTTTPNPAMVWPQRGFSLIAYLSDEQQRQRGGYAILTNTSFRNYIYNLTMNHV